MKPIAALILTVLAVLLFLGAAFAHETATGWSYDPGCCNAYDGVRGDCMVIETDAVQFNEVDGSYTIVASGERFLPPPTFGQPPRGGEWKFLSDGRSHKVNAQARWSKDGMFHRCFRKPDNPADGTYCLYVPSPGF